MPETAPRVRRRRRDELDDRGAAAAARAVRQITSTDVVALALRSHVRASDALVRSRSVSHALRQLAERVVAD